jgi:hypothetical protein
MVTSHKMIEREMEYRGSKSVVIDSYSTVKEQRVDGSYIGHRRLSPMLRCTLMGLERDYQVRVLSNQIIKHTILPQGRNFTTASKIETVASGYWIAGFVDAEGCFRLSIIKNKNFKGNPWLPSLYNINKETEIIPLSVRLYFQIWVHKKDELILKLIQSKLGVGKIYDSRTDMVELQVNSIKDMGAVINFFDKYPLITQKWADYLLFKKAYELILNKEHLTIKGLISLVEIKSLINKGLSDQLKEAFPNLGSNNIERCEVIKDIISPSWVSGFTSGEGSFKVRITKSASHLTGYQVQLKFQITQHKRDKKLMEKLIDYLGCGYISERGDIVDFHVTKFEDIIKKIIPFFEKYPILGIKYENFRDFCRVAEIMKNKEHLTLEGLEKIRLIKSKMNTLR